MNLVRLVQSTRRAGSERNKWRSRSHRVSRTAGCNGNTRSSRPNWGYGATGAQGPVGPQSIAGKIYEKTGPFVTNVGTFTKSTISCNPGDTLVSGGSTLTINSRWDTAPIEVRSDGDTSTNQWEASIFPADILQSVSAQATVFCFDNP